MLFDPCTLLSMCSLFRIHRAFQMPKLFTLSSSSLLLHFISLALYLSKFLYLFSLISLFHILFTLSIYLSIYLSFVRMHARTLSRKCKNTHTKTRFCSIFKFYLFCIRLNNIFARTFCWYRNPSSLVFGFSGLVMMG